VEGSFSVSGEGAPETWVTRAGRPARRRRASVPSTGNAPGFRACPFRTAPRSPSGGTAPPPAIIASPTRAIVFPSGPKYRYIYAKIRKLVADKLTKAMADRNGGIVFDEQSLTISDVLDVWLFD
jgi:hypothetical protein